ncbi:putative pentatricopeptide [Lupinus albus]|uniref:Putative pentatricopeptide n=1 Tax=Lupinus albus TaxID=3870 RepID=A0A6A4Q7X5_LUPAL|nr:putative pentatricopeptide [Lupinus albus]
MVGVILHILYRYFQVICSFSLYFLFHLPFSIGRSFHQHVVTYEFSYIGSSLINFYVKFGFSDVACKVFDYMPHRNVVPWTTIMGCYSQLGSVDEAFYLFNQMRTEGIRPSNITMLILLFGVSEGCLILCIK